MFLFLTSSFIMLVMDFVNGFINGGFGLIIMMFDLVE